MKEPVMITVVVSYADGSAMTLVQQMPVDFKSDMIRPIEAKDLFSTRVRRSSPLTLKMEWRVGEHPANIYMAPVPLWEKGV